MDLRSFLRVLCMDWEQRSLYCNKEAAVTYTCCCLSNKLVQVSWWISRQRYFKFISWHLAASKQSCSFVKQVECFVIVWFLGDFTPDCIVLVFPRCTGNFGKTAIIPETKLPQQRKNYLQTTYELIWITFYPSCVGPFSANLWQAAALSCASQHPQETEIREHYKLHLPSIKAHCQLMKGIIFWALLDVMKMRASASPQLLSSKRPASDKGKGDRSCRSLSSLPLFLYVSLPFSPALCSSLSADAPSTAATFCWK